MLLWVSRQRNSEPRHDSRNRTAKVFRLQISKTANCHEINLRDPRRTTGGATRRDKIPTSAPFASASGCDSEQPLLGASVLRSSFLIQKKNKWLQSPAIVFGSLVFCIPVSHDRGGSNPSGKFVWPATVSSWRSQRHSSPPRSASNVKPRGHCSHTRCKFR